MRNTNAHFLKMLFSWKSVVLKVKTAAAIPAWLKTRQDQSSALGLCLLKVRTHVTSSVLSCSLKHNHIVYLVTML